MWGDRCKCVAPGDFDAETGKCREMIAYESFGEFPEWMNWNMGTSNGYVRVDAYPESGAEIHAAPEVASSLMSSADQRVILGQRLLYDSRSAGMLAESIFFDRALTWEELTEVNAYLQRKWMEPFPEFPLNFRLRTGGTLDLNGLEIEVASLSGGGTVVNGGNASVATLEAEVNADGAVDAPVIEGDFDLAKLGTVALSGTANLSTTRPATLLTATGVLAGDSAAVQIESDATPNRKIKLFKEGNSLKVLLRGGMMVIIR